MAVSTSRARGSGQDTGDAGGADGGGDGFDVAGVESGVSLVVPLGWVGQEEGELVHEGGETDWSF